MAARQAFECEEDRSNSVIKITNCLRDRRALSAEHSLMRVALRHSPSLNNAQEKERSRSKGSENG